MNPQDPAPTDDPRELGRVCPACQGSGQVVLATANGGEAWITRECGLCEGAGEITRATENRLLRATTRGAS